MSDPASRATPEIRLAWNGKSLSARGLGVYLALAVLTIVGSNLYAGYLTQRTVAEALATASKQHEAITRSLDRTSCQVNLTLEDRARFRESYAPGAFKRWCPWVEE
jgi:hypothetical protein